MLSRAIDRGVRAEVEAVEVVDRCCAAALQEYRDACADSDHHRRRALRALEAGDLGAAVEFARREGAAELARRAAWVAYRESVDLLLTLVSGLSDSAGRQGGHLAVAG
jgi:hypothetical protein